MTYYVTCVKWDVKPHTLTPVSELYLLIVLSCTISKLSGHTVQPLWRLMSFYSAMHS